MAKIFVHIGLPKTATTTLQTQIFPSIDQELVKYVGVLQPRGIDQSQEYSHFIQAINSGNIERSRREIEGLLQYGRSLLISEEMILVSEGEVDWRTKLMNLSAILAGFEYSLILTVREPASALYSYYVELYQQFYTDNKSFLELAKHDPRMEIFHYGKLMHVLMTLFDTEHLFVKKFEEIISGDIADLCELITPGSDLSNSIDLKNENSKMKSDKHVYTGKKLTATDIVMQVLRKGNISDIGLERLKKVFRPLKLALNRIPVKRVKVAKPGIEEQKELREYLREETQVLEHLYGIKYV